MVSPGISREEVLTLIAEALQRPIRCTAENPHEGKLRYSGGSAGIYRCECGQRYVKDGHAGLRDAPVPLAVVGG